MNLNEIKDRFAELSRVVKLDDVPFDIVRDPVTDFLYDKTVPSDLIKAKNKRALVEVMKIYRTDLEKGWDKYLTRLTQTTYRHQAKSLFKEGDLKSIHALTLAKWGEQLKVDSLDNIFEPRGFASFSFVYWSDFEEIYQERGSLAGAFSHYGLANKEDSFLRDAYFLIKGTTSGRQAYTDNAQTYNMPQQKYIKEDTVAEKNGTHSQPQTRSQNAI